jgi:2-keto-3-deoxy-L-rhamnonate aldolase RhmA
MNRLYSTLAVTAALGFVMLGVQGQTPPRQTPQSSADPYANNPDAGKLKFPLAAPAGKDSGAITTAPPGAVNQGMLDPAKWKYGTAFDAPPNSKIWNPVMLKMMKGEKVTGGTVFNTDSPETYCAMANAGYDFIWTEMQHDARDWEAVGRMWKACPLGKRSQGGGQAFGTDFWGDVPGGYRNTINDNVVLIEMIETLDGARDAREIAAIPGVTAIFAASGDLGNFSGYKQGSPDYERLINIVHDAALGAGKRLCGPFAWRDRPDFTCFQNGSETAAIARGVADELGGLKDTQGKPEVGPYAVKK